MLIFYAYSIFPCLQLYAIELAIRLDDERIRRLNMELLDVFTHIETPPTSDDEDPESPILNPPQNGHIYQLLLSMLAVVSTLNRDTAYSELYYDRNYLKNVNKKLKKMKKNAKKSDFETIYRSAEFVTHLNQILHTYPDNGGRPFLNYLVALESYLTTEYESESESEYESEPKEPIKKLKFDKDDDNDYQGGQMIEV